MKHWAVYPGSFDPFTLGHLDIVQRASGLFDYLLIGVGINIDKQPLFTPEERVELIRMSVSHLKNIEVVVYQGLTVKFVQESGAKIMIRGVRPLTDIPAELTMMMANRRLAPEIETLFMIADGELAHVSSSLIKEIASVADEKTFSNFLPVPIVKTVLEKIKATIEISDKA
ncbi:MAG: pantetheine-phosphate adenylyltransferase [Planctomycetaceae bacterium]|jgi:pantetheine-phosphate adenylyltransferase|nr:pantetheine-phosphate adenylyltransferase [Planctomycetaceae bacterium]